MIVGSNLLIMNPIELYHLNIGESKILCKPTMLKIGQASLTCLKNIPKVYPKSLANELISSQIFKQCQTFILLQAQET